MKFLNIAISAAAMLAGITNALPSASPADSKPCTYPIGNQCGKDGICIPHTSMCMGVVCPGYCSKLSAISEAHDGASTIESRAAADNGGAGEGEHCAFHLKSCQPGLTCWVTRCGFTPFCAGKCVKF